MPASKKVICRCHLYCTSFNEATGEYEGPGQRVSYSTKLNHMKDSRIPGTIFQCQVLPGAQRFQRHTPTTISDIMDEFMCLSSWSVLSNVKLLKFRNIPNMNGQYIQPSLDNILVVNSEIYALVSNSQSNQYFLAAESSYCNQLARLRCIPSSVECDIALYTIENELMRINRQKGLE